MPVVSMPNGDRVSFPDTMPKDQIRALIQQRFPETASGGPQEAVQQQQPQSGAVQPSMAANRLDALTNGLTMGLGPYLTAGEAALLGRTPEGDWFNYEQPMSERFNTALETERQQNQQFREEHPVQAFTGEVAGGVLSAGGLGSMAAKAAPKVAARLSASIPGRTVQGAALGGTMGTTQAIGEGEDVTTGALTGMAGGAAGSLAAELLTSAGGRIVGALRKKIPTMSADELRQTSTAAFDAVENSNAIYSKQAMKKLSRDVRAYLANEGYHPKLQGNIKTIVDELDRLSDQNVTTQGMMTTRRLMQKAFDPQNPDSNRMLSKIIDRFDNMAGSQSSMLSGNASETARNYALGRDMWRRVKKYETVVDLLEKAKLQAGTAGSGGNIDNATRQKLRTMLTNKKLRRGLKPDELKALNAIAMGTPVQNALRLVGKLSPSGNGLMAALHLMGAGATGGASIPIAGVGMASKAASDRMTQQGVRDLERLIAAGGSRSAITPAPNAAQQLLANPMTRQLLSRGLIAGGVAAQ